MRQLFTLVTLFCAMFVSQNAMATSKTFYAKCKVQVAEESIGRGTVYLLDDSGEEVEETTGWGNATEMPGNTVTSQFVSFNYVAYPEPGYELVNFTDAEGNVHEVGNGYVSVTAMSEDEANPTLVTLFAHFQEAEPVDNNYHFTGTVYESMKFGLMVLPVDYTLPETLNAYKAMSIDEDAIVLEKVKNVVPAGTPVILENLTANDVTVTAEFDKELIVDGVHTAGVLAGAYTECRAPEGAYNLMAYPKTRFEKVDTDFPVPAFTCYLYSEDATAATLDINTSVLTGINKVLSSEEKVQIFDAAGRLLNHLQKGLNIVNGVKVMVK